MEFLFQWRKEIISKINKKSIVYQVLIIARKIKIKQVFVLLFPLLDALTPEIHMTGSLQDFQLCYNVTFSVRVFLAFLFKMPNHPPQSSVTCLTYFFAILFSTVLITVLLFFCCVVTYPFIHSSFATSPPPLEGQLHDGRDLFVTLLFTVLPQNLGHFVACTKHSISIC